MALVQKWPFLELLFLGNIGQKNCLLRCSRTKNPFLRYEKRSSKRRKIEIFPKGLTHGVGAKMAIFATSFFR